MQSREIVRRAIEFDTPPRLPFFLGGSWSDKLSQVIRGFPNDGCDCWEMDRGEAGWFFDNPVQDDWGCLWRRTEVDNMGQVVGHPLEDWGKLAAYQPPDPRNPFYFARIEDDIRDAGGRNEFVPFFIDVGVDVLNMQQPQAYGIRDLGRSFAGKVCFLTTVDIQATLPGGDPEAVRAEAWELVEHWSTPEGGFIVFNYGDSEGIGTSDHIAEVMFQTFYYLKDYWTKQKGQESILRRVE